MQPGHLSNRCCGKHPQKGHVPVKAEEKEKVVFQECLPAVD